MTRIALLHPGQMGAAVGHQLTRAGHRVEWAGQERSEATHSRAGDAGLIDAGSIAEAAASADVVLSICPPSIAEDVATTVKSAGFAGSYIDANAVSPETTRRIEETVSTTATYVDGGIIGGPPTDGNGPRLYLSGDAAADAAQLFANTSIETVVISGGIGAASALKMCYAAFTKGRAALLLAIEATAQCEGVADDLHLEWEASQPAVMRQLSGAADAGIHKGGRWVREMFEIADTFAAADIPSGFHQAAANVFTRTSGPDTGDPLHQLVRRISRSPR